MEMRCHSDAHVILSTRHLLQHLAVQRGACVLRFLDSKLDPFIEDLDHALQCNYMVDLPERHVRKPSQNFMSDI